MKLDYTDKKFEDMSWLLRGRVGVIKVTLWLRCCMVTAPEIFTLECRFWYCKREIVTMARLQND